MIKSPQRITTLLSLLASISFSALLHAEIYRHVDADGNISYTDQPAKASKAIELAPVNTQPFPKGRSSNRPTGRDDDEEIGDYSLTIHSPEDGFAVPNGPGNVSVSTEVSPELQAGHQLQLQVDGTPMAGAGSFELTNLSRGSHTLILQVTDESGQVLASSSSVTIYVHRPIAK